MRDTRARTAPPRSCAVTEGNIMDAELLAALLVKAKTTLRITTNAFDAEISDIIEAAYYDLVTRGVIIETTDSTISPLILRAVLTYVRWHFGEPENPERLRESYIEQRGQLMSTSGFTNWGDE